MPLGLEKSSYENKVFSIEDIMNMKSRLIDITNEKKEMLNDIQFYNKLKMFNELKNEQECLLEYTKDLTNNN
jgi:hypothetical protein